MLAASGKPLAVLLNASRATAEARPREGSGPGLVQRLLQYFMLRVRMAVRPGA